MKYLARVLIPLLCLLLVFGAAGCSKDTVPPVITDVSSSGVTGSSATITWTTDEKATSQVEYSTTGSFSSSSDLDSSLVTSHTVSLSGLAANTTYHYRVKSADKAGNEAVSDDYSLTTPQPVTGVTLNKTSTTIVKGLTEQLVATVQPPNATNQAIAWSSSDNAVVSVSATGLVTGVNAGTATITVTSADQGLTASCAVTVLPEGQAPALKVGNKWTYELTDNGTYYTVVYEITGDGTVNGEECWVMLMSWTPDLMGVSSMTSRMSKATLLDLQGQFSMTIAGYTASASVVCSYSPSNASPFPLEVGKQFSATTTETTTMTFMGETTTETETTAHTYKVEAVEQVTVQAGTFKCFKITDTSNQGVSTSWYSDQAKLWVKTVSDDGSTMELKSYSL